MKLAGLFTIAALGLTVALGPAAAEDATIVGTLVDSKCYLGMDEKDNDHGAMKGCGTMCLKGGTPAGVLTKDNRFHAIIAESTALADFVGLPVRVAGSLHNGSVLAKKIEVNKDGKWQQIKLGAMM